MRRQIARWGLLALGISVVAVLAFAWGHVNPDGAQADADGPAMSLSAPGTVYMGETFVITVLADPAPDEDIAGFGSEVTWFGSDEENPQAGLKWVPREFCDDFDAEGNGLGELQVQRRDGRAIALCNSFVPALTNGASVAVLSQFAQPAAALDVAPGTTTPLLELDFVCNTQGSYELTLTAVPGSPDGALFGAPSGAEIRVKTVDDVADTLTIECSDEPPPTDTPEPTDIPPTDASPTDTPEASVEPTIGGPDDGVAGGAGDSGANGGLWVLIGALLAASVAGMTIFGWRYVRVQ